MSQLLIQLDFATLVTTAQEARFHQNNIQHQQERTHSPALLRLSTVLLALIILLLLSRHASHVLQATTVQIQQ